MHVAGMLAGMTETVSNTSSRVASGKGNAQKSTPLLPFQAFLEANRSSQQENESHSKIRSSGYMRISVPEQETYSVIDGAIQEAEQAMAKDKMATSEKQNEETRNLSAKMEQIIPILQEILPMENNITNQSVASREQALWYKLIASFVSGEMNSPAYFEQNVAIDEAIIQLLTDEFQAQNWNGNERMSPVPIHIQFEPDTKTNQGLVAEQMNEIYAKAKQLIAEMTDSTSISKFAADLYHLLKQWIALEAQLVEMEPTASGFGSSDPIWKDLVSAFKNKEEHHYKLDSRVSVNDIRHWLKATLQKDSVTESSIASTIWNKRKELYSKAEHILSNLHGSQEVPKAAPEVLSLLKQWTALDSETFERKPAIFPVRNESTFDSIWKDLVTLYENKPDATVKDVANWIERLQQNNHEKVVPLQHTAQQLPISKIEQYVIHLEPGENAKQSLSFRNQFESIIQSSRLMTQPNGNTQLSIALKPANLGQMLVHFTEVNGEMLVKIIVTSNQAKQMLESNLHQLKHIFSPHQVMIEKQEGQMYIAPFTQEEESKEQAKEQDKHHEQQQQKRKKEQIEHSFSDYIQKSLLNEKV